jgi:hypothetical protein
MLVEVLSVGVPIIEYENKLELNNESTISDLSIKTLAPPTVLKFNSINDLKENLKIIELNYMNILNKNKTFFEVNHSKEAVSGIMRSIVG